MTIRMPNAGSTVQSLRNAEDAFWQSRATVDGKRGEFFRTTNLHQLAKDIRNAPPSAFASDGRHEEIAFIAATTVAFEDFFLHGPAPDTTPFGVYLVKRPARDGSSGLPEAGRGDDGGLESSGGSAVGPGRDAHDEPGRGSGVGGDVLQPGTDVGKDVDSAARDEAIEAATAAYIAAQAEYDRHPTAANYTAANARLVSLVTATAAASKVGDL